MAKLTLGKRPGAFKKTVHIPLCDGGTDEIEFVFKYRTRTEYGKLMDELAAKPSQEDGAATPKEKWSLEKFIGKSVEEDADFILMLAEGWDLSDEFSRESLISLVDMHAGATDAIHKAYATGLREYREKN
ncbi:phage tail assembly chaperone [Noviherbaspirillum autotrophicum]|uniref:Tail assembly chaperone n=1 Tax=Noviherbaspirillum autotrophicum TaxID=709839 RepID=A0A0C2BRT4_9BURK|nr:phage tail assembly chaperone [Noviherbaspirillum autotrophicum]KIF80776.1 hypothetical protein TSA66_07995 [Noviherbaspirillum autotrophicum]KIF80813.1 hypothetical protein TSA66_08240 [Noviherbaspirillum autotrophicum]KIF84038.1 hypothetical protein TSA66_00930 [Noviherbaspirillum autotrophicum]